MIQRTTEQELRTGPPPIMITTEFRRKAMDLLAKYADDFAEVLPPGFGVKVFLMAPDFDDRPAMVPMTDVTVSRSADSRDHTKQGGA